MSKFQVSSTLDLTGITDADLQSDRDNNPANKPRLLNVEGTYNFVVAERRVLEGRVDGAGKKWGTLLLKLTEKETGNIVRQFLDYPIESVLFTSRAGRTNTIKTKVFAQAAGSVLGKVVSTSQLPKITENIESTFAEGSEMRASVKYTTDHITRAYNGDTKVATFSIKLADGSIMNDENGDALSFAEYEAASAYYQQVTGKQVRSGMSVTSYLPRATASLKKVG